MASGHITSWQIDGETVETVADFILGVSKFMYDLNKIPYDYIVEVRNRFKGLDLIDCLRTMGGSFTEDMDQHFT